MLNKINAREYLRTNDLLQVAIESKDDKQVDTVLRAYERSEVRIVLSALPNRTKSLLYGGNWNKDVIERLYPYTTSYFIPRGQNKAKMFSLTCYTTYDRKGAREEADYITKGLKHCGFTNRGPLIDYDSDHLLNALSAPIDEIKDTCSMLFICIMCHGDIGILYDANDKPVKINKILSTLDKLHTHIPAVSKYYKHFDCMFFIFLLRS